MERRTSTTHPREIDELPCALRYRFDRHDPCPCKRGTSYFGGRWERDLPTDMRAVVDWGATTLATLMECSLFPDTRTSCPHNDGQSLTRSNASQTGS